jgi:hypothetical protein|tara:strand:+ start:373 stop:1242 length:870 start_codon:yes stop_codon:yes gene_type:complete
MTVYLGTFGEVELKRQFDGGELTSTVDPADVNVTAKRFSFDFEHGQLLTGDQIEITSTNNAALSFVSGHTSTSIKKFIHVDELDGVRLFNTFAHAMSGDSANAVVLASPASAIPIKVAVENAAYRVLGRVQSYELNTTRETVDTTTLSDEFRSQISTVMSGSGRLSCEWEYTGDTVKELPHYLLELALRTKVGSSFAAKFYLKTFAYNPASHAGADDDQLWYEVTGVLTACAVQFNPNSLVQITADFITTGPIQIKALIDTGDALLQEDSGDIRLDQDSAAKLLLQQDV